MKWGTAKEGKIERGKKGLGCNPFPLFSFSPLPLFKVACQYVILIAAISSSAFAQQNNSGLTVEGVVVDSNGAPIVEAHVQLAGAAGSVATTNTRSNGTFQLRTDSHESLILIVKAAGFAPFEQKVSSASQSALQIVLMPPFCQRRSRLRLHALKLAPTKPHRALSLLMDRS